MTQYNLYFSPTGGTKKVAEAVAEGWGGDFRAVDLLKSADKKLYKSDDVCLFAVPSYGGRIPTVVVERLGELAGNGAKAVLIAVFGNRAIDDTLLELSDELKKAGFHPIAAMEAVAQHSLIPEFGSGRPDAEDIAELREYGRKIREALEQDTLSRELRLPGNRPYRKYGGVPLKPYVASGCIGCGICAEECPAGAIPMLNFHTTDEKKCISCMRCVEVCPRHVRKLGKVMTFMAAQKMKKVCSGRKNNKLYL